MHDCTLTMTDLGCVRGGRTIFSGLSASVQSAQMLVLKGPNGAGKSSLLLCLAQILHPAAGTIGWTSEKIAQSPATALHFAGHQNAIKSHLTLSENLQFWKTMCGGEGMSVEAALKSAGLAHIAHLEAAVLSTGQARRLSLARLLVTERPLWLLDEPTAALDHQGEQWVTSLITSHLDRGGLVVAATHLELSIPDKTRSAELHLKGTQ